MIKRGIIVMADVDTGEVLGHTRKETQLENCPDLDNFLSTWLESFKRGLRQGRNLTISFTFREYLPPVELSVF